MVLLNLKSEWTYNKNKENVKLKEKGCIDKGLDFTLLIYNGEGKIKNKLHLT